MATVEAVSRDEQHWYRQHVGECPVCGRDKSFRERVAGEPPENPAERYVYISDAQTYDHCLG